MSLEGMDSEDHNPIIGWLWVVFTVLGFGSFGVPIKSKRVLEAQVHPLTYQTYKTVFAFLTSWIALTYNEFHYTPWGILSGLFWVPGGIATVYAVTHAGLAVGQGTTSSMIVVVSFLWGLAFGEPIKSIPLAILAAFLLIIGIIGMSYFSAVKKNVPPPQINNSILNNNEKNTESGLSPLMGQNEPPTIKIFRWQIKKNIFGIIVGLVGGLWGGSIYGPLKLAPKGETSGIQYVVSFAIGALIVNLFLWYVMLIYCVIKREKMPSLHLRVMAIPGAISGLLWSFANYCSIYAVIYLGQAIGYSASQMGIAIAGMWGIFYHKEIVGWRILHWFLSAATALSGIIVMAFIQGKS